MAKKVRVHIFVSGLVQGIFFRSSTKKTAQKLGAVGWVRNLPDSRVEIVAEGEKQKIEELVEWVKEGPAVARVDNLDVEYEEYKGEFNSFEVRY